MQLRFAVLPEILFSWHRGTFVTASSHTRLSRENTRDCALVTERRARGSRLAGRSLGGMSDHLGRSLRRNLQPLVYCVGADDEVGRRRGKAPRGKTALWQLVGSLLCPPWPGICHRLAGEGLRNPPHRCLGSRRMPARAPRSHV